MRLTGRISQGILVITLVLQSHLPLIAQEHFGKATDLVLRAKESDDIEQKINLLRQAVEAAPSYADARLELGKIYLSLSDFQQANKQLAMYSALRPVDPDGLYYRGVVNIALGNSKKAIDYLELSLSHDKDNWNTHNKLGELLLDRNDVSSAKKHFQKSLEINAYNASALLGLGNVHSSSGDFPEAMDAFQAALKIDPNFSKARTKLDEIKKAKQVAVVSRKRKELSKEKVDNLISIYIANAKTALRENNLENARSAFEKALSLQANREVLDYIQLLNQGVTSLSMTKWDSAHFYFNKALLKVPQDTLASAGKHYALARMAMDSGNLHAIIRELEMVADLDNLFMDTNELLAGFRKTSASTRFTYQYVVLVGLMIFSIGTGFLIFRKRVALKQHLETTANKILKSKVIENTNTFFENSKLNLSKWIRQNEEFDLEPSTVTIGSVKSPSDLTAANRYKILEELGVGGMGRVSRAWDRILERIVCLKTIRYSANFDTQIKDDLEKRFLLEARAAAKLNHPNIITIYDIQKIDRQIYISMEYLKGSNLDAVIQREGVEYKRASKIILQACQALEFAHNHGIIHRDIKPPNIILLENELIKILDFGLARLSNSKLTRTGYIMGTPSYMSPEQTMGSNVNHQSDIFSLGIVFYELVTGQKPFCGETAQSIAAQILIMEPKIPSLICPNVPKKVDRIIQKMLAKDIKERYQNCEQIIDELKSILN